MKVVKIIILIGAIINIAVWLDINIFLASVFLIIAITTLILLLKEYDTSDIEEKINDEIEKEKRLYNNIKENNDKLKVQLEPLRSYTEHFDSGMIHRALPMAT